MGNENLIHVKFEYEEAIQAKKDMLSSEITLLKIVRIIRSYHNHRDNEFELKLGFCKKIKELKSIMWNLQKTLPKLKIPEILKKGSSEEKEYKYSERKKQPSGNIEEQLQEIQRRLNNLQNK